MKTIRKFIVIVFLALVSLPGFASEQKKSDAGQEAGKWLALIDAGQYGESWKRSASLFRQQITAEYWSQAVTAARKPLGNMVSRKLKSATYATTLPGAPDGEYVVLQYQTEFTHKKFSIETVTPMLDDGQWRVSGYYVR